jgi:hypothetical protein
VGLIYLDACLRKADTRWGEPAASATAQAPDDQFGILPLVKLRVHGRADAATGSTA